MLRRQAGCGSGCRSDSQPLQNAAHACGRQQCGKTVPSRHARRRPPHLCWLKSVVSRARAWPQRWWFGCTAMFMRCSSWGTAQPTAQPTGPEPSSATSTVARSRSSSACDQGRQPARVWRSLRPACQGAADRRGRGLLEQDSTLPTLPRAPPPPRRRQLARGCGRLGLTGVDMRVTSTCCGVQLPPVSASSSIKAGRSAATASRRAQQHVDLLLLLCAELPGNGSLRHAGQLGAAGAQGDLLCTPAHDMTYQSCIGLQWKPKGEILIHSMLGRDLPYRANGQRQHPCERGICSVVIAA